MRADNRYVSELPSGIIKNPVLKLAGDDLSVNDVVVLSNDVAMPMYSENQTMYGVVAVKVKKGDMVLLAASE